MLQTLPNETVAESSYRRIRSDIIFDRLHPGQKLKLDNLNDAYGTSISTLREILNRLSADGFVLAEGQRGFEVAPVSASNLQEIAALRLLLETHALSQSMADGDTEWEARVVSAHYKLTRMEDVITSSDADSAQDWKRYDREFHQSLISACGSNLLMETHSNVFDKYLRYQMVAQSYRGNVASAEHQQLLDAALARDEKTAKKVLTMHIHSGMEHALAVGKFS